MFTTIKFYILLTSIFLSCIASGQNATVKGKVTCKGRALEYAVVSIKGTSQGSMTDSTGQYQITDIKAGSHIIMFQCIGYMKQEKRLMLKSGQQFELNLDLQEDQLTTDEVVISATMKEVSKMDCPVSVEVYSSRFFKSNPTPSVFDALQNINGVRPQINCNVCNTGDIHINGLEGPYTMVLIDGMPLVSGLSTVYGLSGIPQSLIDRVEIVKGPASTLYGSEAVGGLINIITKKTANAPTFSADIFGTTWQEWSADLSTKVQAGKKAQGIAGLNLYSYQLPIDRNQDGFTDVTLQQRISAFSKWNALRPQNRVFSIAGRYVYEDRWGGDMRWDSSFRGGDSIYGESIYTKRWEFYSQYELPTTEKLNFSFSANGHDQNSVYGSMKFNATQVVAFGQLTWQKLWAKHELLLGATNRYTYFDDDTPATSQLDTQGVNANHPSRVNLPGIFVQDDWRWNDHHRLLAGIRLDHHTIHGKIVTPRLNYQFTSADRQSTVRAGIGSGYRVAQIFTEDHAALTGSRQTIFLDDLKPETSWNGNVQFSRRWLPNERTTVGFDLTGFYTQFQNRIIADYLSDPNKIIYDNLHGYAVSRGVSFNLDIGFQNGPKLLLGMTYQDVYSVNRGEKLPQLFTEKWSGNWNINYQIRKWHLQIDYNGKVYGPMKLPLLSAFDPRSEYSPIWSIQNIQLTASIGNNIEIYGGIKNLLNWTPAKGNPFIIARSHDPFDKQVNYDADGQVMRTAENPYALTFDPTYVYGPNQGMRLFLGIRYHLYK